MEIENKKRRIGRPSISPDQRHATRRRIIETAKILFAREGIESVSMRKIATEAGFSQKLPYLYFKNKQAILRYIWEDFFVALFSKCNTSLKGIKGAQNRLDVFLRTYVDYWFDHPEQYELVFLNKDQIGGPEDQYYVEEFGVLGRYDILTDLVQDCIDDGSIKKGDPALYAQMLLASVHGILHCLITVSEYPWQPKKQLIDTTLQTLFSGLKN